jgi:DNA-nicking Smr family endonuclease
VSIDDYWIGDRVWIAHLHCEGIFEGTQGEMAVVKVKGRKELVAFPELTRLDEPAHEPGVDPDDYSGRQVGKFSDISLDDTLDLHIDTLNPGLIHAGPEQILAHQRIRLKDYIRKAIDQRKYKVTIIHGKGEGVLRSEVLHMLAGMAEIERVQHELHGGAVVVFFHRQSTK